MSSKDSQLTSYCHPAQVQRHLYTQIRFNRLAVDTTFPGMYAGILRLSHKYDAKELHGLISLSLTQQWPSSWESWTSVHRIGYLAENHPNPGLSHTFLMEYKPSDR